MFRWIISCLKEPQPTAITPLPALPPAPPQTCKTFNESKRRFPTSRTTRGGWPSSTTPMRAFSSYRSFCNSKASLSSRCVCRTVVPFVPPPSSQASLLSTSYELSKSWKPSWLSDPLVSLSLLPSSPINRLSMWWFWKVSVFLAALGPVVLLFRWTKQIALVRASGALPYTWARKVALKSFIKMKISVSTWLAWGSSTVAALLHSKL